MAVLDASAIAMLCADGELRSQAESAFRICRHTVVDLVGIFPARPVNPAERLTPAALRDLQSLLSNSAAPLDPSRLNLAALARLRSRYQPQAAALCEYFVVAVPAWLPDPNSPDSWRTDPGSHQQNQRAVSDPYASDNPGEP